MNYFIPPDSNKLALSELSINFVYYHKFHNTILMVTISFKEKIIIIVMVKIITCKTYFLTTNDKFVLPHNNIYFDHGHNLYRKDLFLSFVLQ